MNAWYDGNDSLTGGLAAASVSASAASSMRRATGASSGLKPFRSPSPSGLRHSSSSLVTCDVTQPSRIIPPTL